jgi:hypothetical protein
LCPGRRPSGAKALNIFGSNGTTKQAAEKRWFAEESSPQRLLMTAKLMSGSACFEPISKSALYRDTTSVVPKTAGRTRALAPAALFPSQFGFGQRLAAPACDEDIIFATFNKAGFIPQ